METDLFGANREYGTYKAWNDACKRQWARFEAM